MRSLRFGQRKSIRCMIKAAMLPVFCMIYQSGNAQIAIGPKAGATVTTLAGSDAQNVNAKLGYLGGVFVNLQAAPWFTVQPEVIVSQKGATYTRDNTKTELNLHYIEVPVLAKIRIPIDKVFYPHVLAGPNVAFNTDARYVSTDSQSGTVVQGDGDNFRKADVGAVVGAGLDIQSKRVFFTVDGRYGYAFNYLENGRDNSPQLRIRNAGWTFSLGVGIRLFADNDD